MHVTVSSSTVRIKFQTLERVKDDETCIICCPSLDEVNSHRSWPSRPIPSFPHSTVHVQCICIPSPMSHDQEDDCMHSKVWVINIVYAKGKISIDWSLLWIIWGRKWRFSDPPQSLRVSELMCQGRWMEEISYWLV